MTAIVGYRPVLALCATLLLLACAGPPPRAVNPTRPLDERRAIEVIVSAFRDGNDVPTPGTKLMLGPAKPLHVDVVAQGHQYGVAYVTAQERLDLGSFLPPREPSMGDALQLVSGLGADSDARILVLEDSDYLYDDNASDAHEASALTAEIKLKRDVRDFLVRAHAEKWP